eukprot:7979713-Karenia_brevis.AAC.1
MDSKPSLIPDLDPDSDDEVDDADAAHATHPHNHDLDPTSDTEGRQCNVVLHGQELAVEAITQPSQNDKYEVDSCLEYDPNVACGVPRAWPKAK